MTDLGTAMVVGTFLLAMAVFLVAAAIRISAARRAGRVTPFESDVTPPPLPAGNPGEDPWIGGNQAAVAPFEPSRATAVPGRGSERWWKVSSAIYNWYDLPMMALLVLLYAGAPVAMILLGEQSEAGVGIDAIVGTIVMQFFLTALVMGFVAWRKRPVEWLGLRWREWPLAFVIAIAGVAATWLVLIVLSLTGYNDWLQGHIGEDPRQEVVKAFGDADDPLLLGLLCFTAVIVAPVTEEVLFRGYLYPASKRFIGRWAALLFTSLVFAVAHANAMALVPLILLAGLLTVAYELTGSLWAPVAIHMLFNGATVAMQLMAKWGLVEFPET